MINFDNLFSNSKNKEKCRLGILGSNGGFGYTFLAQIARMEKSVDLRAVCDLSIERSIEILKELGFDASKLYPCRNEEAIKDAPKDVIIVLDDASLMPLVDCHIVVEATGQPEGSAVNAERCILSGKHVAMVSKEADVVAGPYLYRLAEKMGVTYSIAIGDQPANLICWLSYIKSLGLEIIAAGKSSEYDFIYDLDTGDFQYREEKENIPELKNWWKMKDMKETLENRSRLLSKYPQFAVPDYNEMNVVSNATGLMPSCPRLHYPMINVAELADVYALKEDGGLIEKAGVLDSFNCLHRFDEVSFAGGVFVVVKSHNHKQIDILEAKGHVISKNKKYAALYLPFHYMGMEAPMSVLQQYYLNVSTYSSCNYNSIMVCRTERDFKKGEVLSLQTHHRCLGDIYCTFEPVENYPSETAPYYLIAEKKLTRDIPKGTIITKDMVDLSSSDLYRMMNSVK